MDNEFELGGKTAGLDEHAQRGDLHETPALEQNDSLPSPDGGRPAWLALLGVRRLCTQPGLV